MSRAASFLSAEFSNWKWDWQLIRALMAGAGVALATIGVVMAAPAQADGVAPYSAPPGKGAVRISTAPGGFIDVQVIGRVDAARSSGPAAGGCWVFLGDGVRQNFIAVDPITGSGSTRFGPLENGTYAIGGKCGDRRDMRGVSDLISPSYIGVTIDSSDAKGQGANQPPSQQQPKAPAPPSRSDFNADCAGADIYDLLSQQLPPSIDNVPGLEWLKAVDPAGVIADLACVANLTAYHGGPGNPEIPRRLCDIVQHSVDFGAGLYAPALSWWDFFHRMYPEAIPDSPTDLHC